VPGLAAFAVSKGVECYFFLFAFFLFTFALPRSGDDGAARVVLPARDH
jgi:hypothetical protein